MARRSVEISEEFGVYRVRAGKQNLGATGRTAEDAILRALAMTPGYLGSGAEDREVEIRSSHDMGEVIETLLGPKREDSGLAVAV